MASQQPPGDPKPLIMDSQQPPAYSKTFIFHLEKRANGFTAASLRIQTINISLEKCVNGFTAISSRSQTINPPTPQGVERVGPQTKHRSQPATFLNQHAKRPPELTKHKPATSTKLKPAASIEQSNNRAIESNLQSEPSKLQMFLKGPLEGCNGGGRGRRRGANFLASQLLNIIIFVIKILRFH